MRGPMQMWREYRQCTYWRANLIVAALAAVASAAMLRWSAVIWLVMLPTDSWAAQMLAGVVTMSTSHFALTAAVAAIGGATSFLYEVRSDPTNLRIINALGHMFSAQFAGLLVYLLALEWSWSTPYALASCGLAGWGGNRSIQMLNERLLGRLGVGGAK